MVRLNNLWVCARCKPIFLQRLQEGGPLATPGPGSLISRYKKQLVLRSETPLPDRCVRCNAPANGYRLKRQFYWHPPVYFVLIIAGILVYAVVALCVRKKGLLHIGLCPEHQSQRKTFILISSVMAVTAVGLLVAGIAQYGAIAIAIGIILLLGAAVLTAWKAPVISPAKIKHDFVWVKGAGEAFLANFPEWTGPS